MGSSGPASVDPGGAGLIAEIAQLNVTVTDIDESRLPKFAAQARNTSWSCQIAFCEDDINTTHTFRKLPRHT
jgi:hypothetical protein